MPDGGTLTTLRDAATYIIRLPKREHDAPEWRAAIEALMLVAEHGGDTMLPRVGIMRTLYPDEQRCAGTNVHFGYIVRRAGAFWLTAKGATMAQEADADMVRMNFFGFGFQYYLAGRYAVAAQLLPVAANLLHHAIEMLLRGASSSVMISRIISTHMLDASSRAASAHGSSMVWSLAYCPWRI